MAYPEQDRTILEVSGKDRVSFLQNLVTNSIDAPGLHYAALLTPQGKYIADFFVVTLADAILIDVASILAPPLLQRLSMYRLRADVHINATKMEVACGISDAPDHAFVDPRHPGLGWRDYGGTPVGQEDWAALRVKFEIPETGIELHPDSFILEMGFERLSGVDFKKGCYVGQEVTARMKHKTELRKGLKAVTVVGQAAPGSPIIANEKPAGVLYTNTGGFGLAYLRFDRVTSDMQAEGAIINL